MSDAAQSPKGNGQSTQQLKIARLLHSPVYELNQEELKKNLVFSSKDLHHSREFLSQKSPEAYKRPETKATILDGIILAMGVFSWESRMSAKYPSIYKDNSPYKEIIGSRRDAVVSFVKDIVAFYKGETDVFPKDALPDVISVIEMYVKAHKEMEAESISSSDQGDVLVQEEIEASATYLVINLMRGKQIEKPEWLPQNVFDNIKEKAFKLDPEIKNATPLDMSNFELRCEFYEQVGKAITPYIKMDADDYQHHRDKFADSGLRSNINATIDAELVDTLKEISSIMSSGQSRA